MKVSLRRRTLRLLQSWSDGEIKTGMNLSKIKRKILGMAKVTGFQTFLIKSEGLGIGGR
jgi:phage-related protein